VTPQIIKPLVTLDRIEQYVQLEPALLILGLTLFAWLVSKVFLSNLSVERGRNLDQLFQNLGYHLLFGIGLFIVYSGLHKLASPSLAIERLTTYAGLATIFSGAIIFVKVSRIFVFEYFFLSHMRVSFPVLLINLFTLLLSLILTGWICAEIFNVRLTAIVATSAIFSLVLGLALQDTLGNLFAGVALQFDKPYEIGDWIEVHNGSQKWVGQVYEISWRATVLIAFTDETITLPNRLMAQAEISNFTTKFHPIIRNVMFKLPYGINIGRVKELLLLSAQYVQGVCTHPSPRVVITETSELGITFKLGYYIEQFGEQFRIADRVYTKALELLREDGFELSVHQVKVEQGYADPHTKLN
jgi:small-conductance mechanosensitive channel